LKIRGAPEVSDLIAAAKKNNFLQDVPTEAATDVASAILPTVETATEKKKKKETRELRFEDIQLGKYLGGGAINRACYVKVPDWVYEQHELPIGEPLILKLCDNIIDSRREVQAFRKFNEDEEKARSLKILPLIWGDYNMSNPFYGRSLDSSIHPDSCEYKLIKSYNEDERIGAMVMPIKKKQFIEDKAQTMDDYRRFLRSVLMQLDYAHSFGITNYDLSVGRNIFVDDEMDAILIDWNGDLYPGEEMYDPEFNFAIIPPECWFERILGHRIAVPSENIHAYDVWEVGIMFATMLFYPCEWAHSYCYKNDVHSLLEDTIYAIADPNDRNSTVIRVQTLSDEDESMTVRYLDLAEMVHLESQSNSADSAEFKPILCNGKKKMCRDKLPFLRSLTRERRREAFDFLKSILRLSPSDRPTCAELLKHPFLRYDGPDAQIVVPRSSDD